jgi:hypothetical protein
MLDRTPESNDARRAYKREWMAKKRAEDERARESLDEKTTERHQEEIPLRRQSTADPQPEPISTADAVNNVDSRIGESTKSTASRTPEPVRLTPAMNPSLEEFLAQHAQERASSDVGSPPEPVEPPPVDISRLPKRLPVRTKSRWRTLPAELREDIILREQEFDEAFKRYDGLGNFAMTA